LVTSGGEGWLRREVGPSAVGCRLFHQLEAAIKSLAQGLASDDAIGFNLGLGLKCAGRLVRLIAENAVGLAWVELLPDQEDLPGFHHRPARTETKRGQWEREVGSGHSAVAHREIDQVSGGLRGRVRGHGLERGLCRALGRGGQERSCEFQRVVPAIDEALPVRALLVPLAALIFLARGPEVL
jgi:hypothetical protein